MAITLLAFLALFLWLITRSFPQLLVAVALVAALVLDAVTAVHSLHGVVPVVRGSRELIAGQPTRWVLTVEGVRRPIVVAPARLPRCDEVRVETSAPGIIELPPLSRGVLHSLLLDLTATGATGLFESGRRCLVRLPQVSLVGPPPMPHAIDWPAPRAVRFGVAETAPSGTDLFRGVRDYVRGDPRRSIHWKATAHRGALMVAERDGTGVVALRVIVELPPSGAAADATAARAAFVADEALRRGWVVRLVTMAPVHLTLDGPTKLTSPFGSPPPPPRPAPVPLRVTDHEVRDHRAVLRELAVASSGSPGVERWPGMTCVVSPFETTWS
ncbi:MAG: DUF58 domain-containing protein [Acidimicrobiales bacterium]